MYDLAPRRIRQCAPWPSAINRRDRRFKLGDQVGVVCRHVVVTSDQHPWDVHSLMEPEQNGRILRAVKTKLGQAGGITPSTPKLRGEPLVEAGVDDDPPSLCHVREARRLRCGGLEPAHSVPPATSVLNLLVGEAVVLTEDVKAF